MKYKTRYYLTALILSLIWVLQFVFSLLSYSAEGKVWGFVFGYLALLFFIWMFYLALYRWRLTIDAWGETIESSEQKIKKLEGGNKKNGT